MSNDALDSNPPNADYHLSNHGSDWLWAVFALFGLSLLAVIGWTLAVSPSLALLARLMCSVLSSRLVVAHASSIRSPSSCS